MELRGRILGLFGAGRIGQAVGRRAVPFGMRILYTARNPRPDFERECGAVRVEFSRLLKETDVLRSEEHTSELQSRLHLVCRLLLEKKKKTRDRGLCAIERLWNGGCRHRADMYD